MVKHDSQDELMEDIDLSQPDSQRIKWELAAEDWGRLHENLSNPKPNQGLEHLFKQAALCPFTTGSNLSTVQQSAITELISMVDSAKASGISHLSMAEIRTKARAKVGL